MVVKTPHDSSASTVTDTCTNTGLRHCQNGGTVAVRLGCKELPREDLKGQSQSESARLGAGGVDSVVSCGNKDS